MSCFIKHIGLQRVQSDGGLFPPFLQAKARTNSAAAASANKKARRGHQAKKRAPIDALLTLDSCLGEFNLSLDMFQSKFSDLDPLAMDPTALRDVDLEKERFIIFFADREGSQSFF